MLENGYTPVKTPLPEILNMLINIPFLTNSFKKTDSEGHQQQNAIIFS
jgi:hypothetical protein